MPSTALGPHVVGSRVVVRRIVPGELGPTGGPAFTDVLGVCTSWADGLCIVEPAGGEPVSIPTDLIVSGKPVPERPSVRHRVSVRESEGHVASLWPSVDVEPLGEWQLRIDRSPGVRVIKRANSALAVGAPGMDLAAATARVREFYASHDRLALAHVEVGSEINRGLLDLGWSELPEGESFFQLASLAGLRRRLGAPRSPGDHGAPKVIAEATLARAEIDGLARCEAAVDGDWLGIRDLWITPERRRQGLARVLLAELFEWGAEQGALTAWLHVETDNNSALDLYERLGFMTHHTMRYLTPTP